MSRQTMLLTKRLTTFLSQNTSPQLPSLLLISPTGKLLASSSPLPASQLRTQATLAVTLWNLYQPLQTNNNEALTNTLSASDPKQNGNGPKSKSVPTISAAEDHGDQGSITIQLSEGIMVIRSLKCQLLFIAIGVSPPTNYPTSPKLLNSAQALSTSSIGSPPTSPSPQYTEGNDMLAVGSHTLKDGFRNFSGSSLGGLGSGAPSDAGSVASTTRRAQANIMVVKRQAKEIGSWLEKSLEGLVLSSGEMR